MKCSVLGQSLCFENISSVFFYWTELRKHHREVAITFFDFSDFGRLPTVHVLKITSMPKAIGWVWERRTTNNALSCSTTSISSGKSQHTSWKWEPETISDGRTPTTHSSSPLQVINVVFLNNRLHTTGEFIFVVGRPIWCRFWNCRTSNNADACLNILRQRGSSGCSITKKIHDKKNS